MLPTLSGGEWPCIISNARHRNVSICTQAGDGSCGIVERILGTRELEIETEKVCRFMPLADFFNRIQCRM